METKKASRILAVALSVTAIAVYGCGGGGGGGGGGVTPTGTTGTTISSASEAGSAGGASTQGGSIGSNAGQSLSNIAAGGGSVGAAKYRSPLAGKDARFNKMHAAEVRAMKVPAAKRAAFLRKAKAAAAGSRAPVTIPASTTNCVTSGTITMSGSYDDATFEYNITMTFANCREMGEQLNGTITVLGTFSATGTDTFTMKLGDGDGDLRTETTDTDSDGVVDSVFRVELFSNNYTNLFAKYIADMTVAGSETVEPTATNYSFTYKANGKEEYSDFLETYTMTFTNLIFISSWTYNAATATWSGSDTVNGTFTESWVEAGVTNSVTVTFGDGDTVAEPTTNTNPDFTIGWNETSTYYEFTIDGQIVVAYNVPGDLDCYSGTFLIDTTTPLREDFAMGHISQGTIVVNGNTTIVFSHGQVMVTVDGTSTPYASIEVLENVCPIEDLEEDTGSQTTFGNTTSISGTVTGASSLLATLSWNKANDMDLHLNYYNVDSPTSTTQLFWYVDWHTGVAGSSTANGMKLCTSPLDNVSIWNGIDSNGDGKCEIGLDYDITEFEGGYGPEHITATTLPPGYYVLSVNSYDLSNSSGVSQGSTTVTVTVNIGGNVYTFPSNMFTVADFEGTTAAAWYRVCDIHVTSTGTAHIMEPNIALGPWHTGTYGLASPKARR